MNKRASHEMKLLREHLHVAFSCLLFIVLSIVIHRVYRDHIGNNNEELLNLNQINKKMPNPENWKEAKSIYEFTVRDLNGEEVSLEKYKGHVCIIVNVASQCGYTKNNYAELNELYNEYADSKGLRILAFPCNQFAGQEPGDSAQICQFINSKNVKFDVFEKVNVNGNDAHPLWNYLKYKQGGTLGNFIKWNFTKFIIDKNGQPVERHGPSTSPKELVSSLEKYW